MPPFNFGQVTGQAFQQSFQAAQDRQQQAKRQRALQRLRKRRLEQNARRIAQQREQARKRRQQDQSQFEAKQEAAERRFKARTTEVPRSEVGLSGEGTVRMNAETVAQLNAQEGQSQITVNGARFPFIKGDGQVTMDRDAFQARSRLHLTNARQRNQGTGVVVTNDDFPRMNPLGEGQNTDLGRLPEPLQARALQGMMQQSAPTGDVNIFGNQEGSPLEGESGVPGRQPESPVGEASMTLEPEEVPENSTVGQRARMALGELAEGFAAPFTAPVNAVQEFLYPEVPQQKREQARSSLQRGVKEFQKLRRLPPEQRTRPAAQLTRQLERLRQDLGTYGQTEATKELRKNIRALQKATSQATPGGRGQRALQQGFSKLAQKTLQKALEADDLEQMNTALSNLRKSLNQDVTGSQ